MNTNKFVNEILDNYVTDVEKVLEDHSREVKRQLKIRASNIKELTQAYTKGEITKAELKSEVNSEANLLKAKMLTLKIKNKSAVNNVKNEIKESVLDTINDFIKAS